ncbi:MAG: hypothetical protein Q9170_007262 [Blastenia crenularia]
MGLVEYSESECSDTDDKQQAKQESSIQKHPQKTGKPAFQKAVDRSNPHKIRVNLPEPAKEPTEGKQDEEGPPAKKARIGGGAFSGFNSFLPAPKRPTGGNGGLSGRRGGLGSGVNLKTGSAPGFTREPVIESGPEAEEYPEAAVGENSAQTDMNSLEPSNTEKDWVLDPPKPQNTENPQEKPKKQGNSMMFKPLSVSRKPQKKKTVIIGTFKPETKPREKPPLVQSQPRPKVSLFSTEPSQDDSGAAPVNSGLYQPLIYGADEPQSSSFGSENPYISPSEIHSEISSETVPKNINDQEPQSLTAIASDLNLSASAKRQLFGRQQKGAPQSAVNIISFNTDAEYAANELLRQAGEQVQHNPVRAIAPGKHSLKQLVSAASNQKDALEEQFANGRRNKKEAGGRYGW